MSRSNAAGALVASLVAMSVLGCGSSADRALSGYEAAGVRDEASLRDFLGVGYSAPSVYMQSTAPLAILETADSSANDSGCPVITTQGDERTYTGGCTDGQGNTWFGKATKKGMESAHAGSLVAERFGLSGSTDCDGTPVDIRVELDGSVEVTGDTTSGTFDIDLAATVVGHDDACEKETVTVAWQYSGTRRVQGETETWNGSGVVGSSETGKATVSTRDEVVDFDTCSTEALSGTSTIEAGGDTVVVTYDGATACSDASTVTWTLNGQAQGELSGVSCAAAGGAEALVWAAAALLPLLRRRRRS